jgi:hypothetical protein
MNLLSHPAQNSRKTYLTNYTSVKWPREKKKEYLGFSIDLLSHTIRDSWVKYFDASPQREVFIYP